MTEVFNKYLKWSYLDKTCHRRLYKDAPDYIKNEVRKLDDEYYRKQVGTKYLWIMMNNLTKEKADGTRLNCPILYFIYKTI